MAGTDILSLPIALALDGTEYVPLVQAGVTKRVQADFIANTGSGFVPTSRQVNGGFGLIGGGALTTDLIIDLNLPELGVITSQALADTYTILQDSSGLARRITFADSMKTLTALTDIGLPDPLNDFMIINNAMTGETFKVNPSSLSMVLGGLPAGGTTGQILLKSSATDYDTAWASRGDLTKTDDANVTLTLGGTPADALISDVSLTLGWTGTLAVARGGTGAATVLDARTNLGVAIGSDVQAWNAGLDDIAGLAVTDGNFIVGDGANWVAESGAAARTSLDVYSTTETDNAIAAAVTAEDLDFAGDSGTGSVDLDSQSLAINTSNNSLTTTASAQSLTIALADMLEDLDTLGPPTADGEFLVATGVGMFAYESGNTARTSLGLGTSDSPTFASVTIGASTPFADAAGVLTLQNVDVLDATTEATIESAIDTLANLTSIQGISFTFGAYAPTLLNTANEAAFKAAVNLEIGTDVQAYSANLDLWSAVIPSDYVTLTGAETLSNKTLVNPVIEGSGGFPEVIFDTGDIFSFDTGGNSYRWQVGGTFAAVLEVAAFRPGSELGSDLGTTTRRWDTAYLNMIELGHPTDTPLTRSAAGTLAVAGVDVVLESGAQTITDKTLASPTINSGTLTGVIDAGGATSFELPNSGTPTVNADGEIAVDTTVADFAAGVLTYFATAQMGVVAMPIAEFTSPTDGFVPMYNATTDQFEMTDPASASGATQALDNLTSVAINTTLVSDTDVTDDLGTLAIRWNNIFAARVGTGDTVSDTLALSAYDTNAAALTDILTLTAGNPPELRAAQTFTDTAGAPFGFLQTWTVDPAANSSAVIIGNRSSVEVPSTNAFNHNALIAFAPRVFFDGSGTLNQARACNLVVRNREDGTITTAWGGRFGIQNDGTGTITDGVAGSFGILNNNAAGTIGTFRGISVALEANLGTITDTYGVWIGDMSVGTQTGDIFSIYASDVNAPSYFAAPLEIGDVSDTTLSRISAGVLGVEGIALATIDDVETSDINPQTGTAYTLVIGDRGQTVTMSNASPNTLTIPTNASVAFVVGTVVSVIMLGTGTTTIAGDTGVTVNGVSAGSGDIGNQYQGVSLLKIATNTWVASGDIGDVT